MKKEEMGNVIPFFPSNPGVSDARFPAKVT